MAYLQCDCEQDIFVKVFKLKTTEAGGVVEEINGWRCFECGAKVDTMTLIRRMEIKRKQEEIAVAQREVAEHEEIQRKKEQSRNKVGPGNKPAGADSVPNVRHEP